MKASDEFLVTKGKRVVIDHPDGWRYVIEVSEKDEGDMSTYDFSLEELDSEGTWVRGASIPDMWDASFPALAEAFRFLSPEEER